MKSYVTDTQCLIWYMAKDRHLPRVAQGVFQKAKEGSVQILVPSIVLVEAIFLAQRRRVPEAILAELMTLSEEPNASIRVVPLDMAVVHVVGDFGPAAIPEMPDRIIAATARALDVPLLTTDPIIAESKLVKVVD